MGPPEGRRRFDDVHDQDVSRPSAADGDRARERVALHGAARGRVPARGRGRVVAVRGVARVEDERVAGLRHQARWDRVVPFVVHDGGVEPASLGHESLLESELDSDARRPRRR